jgi:hypothetical protein
VTFLRLDPASEYHSRVAADRRTLTRFPAPAALPICKDPPLSGVTHLSHVAPLHLPCASTLYSLRRLPGILSTRCAHGTEPSELDLTRIAVVSRPGIPSCDWLNASRVKQTFQPTDDSVSPKLAVTRTNSSDNPKAVPPGSMTLPTRFVRTRHCCLARPRFRGFIPSPVGNVVSRFLLATTPWLSWFSPP